MTVQPGGGRAAVARLEKEFASLRERYVLHLRDSTADPQVSSDLGKYVAVRLCGLLEQAVSALSLNHVARFGGGSTVKEFASSWIQRSANPKRGALLEHVGRFDPSWPGELESLLSTLDPEKTLDSFVQTRNDIAHGLTTGIGFDALDNYSSIVLGVIDWCRDKFDPLPTRTS